MSAGLRRRFTLSLKGATLAYLMQAASRLRLAPRALRLGLDEAVSLMVGLQALLSLPGLHERDAAQRALAKLEAAAGSFGQAAASVTVQAADPVDEDLVGRARAAVEAGRRVRLEYLVPGRDESTERDVDPMRVINVDGRWYLEGWCHRAEDTRLFRLDRVEEVEILDADGHPPAQAQARDLSAGVFTPSQDAPLVALALGRGWEWVGEYYPIESGHADGADTIVELRAGDTDWVRRLALRAGGGVRVLAPPSLAQQVAADAAGALAAYGQQG